MMRTELTVTGGRAAGTGRLAAGGGGGTAAAAGASSGHALAGAGDLPTIGAFPKPGADEEPKVGLGALGTAGLGAD